MRVSLDILEVTALVSACQTEETALELRIKSARKVNNLKDVGELAANYADLMMAKRKLLIALKDSTKTKEV